jgi:phenylpyruvate tautomerase PptA (4-oxalocrotonate tautomerase family)
MPFIQVHSTRAGTAQIRRNLGFALAELYGSHMMTDRRIVNVGFTHYGTDELARYDADDGAPREMTIVTCAIRSGRTAETVEALGRAITAACSEALGIDEARIAVYVTEHAAHEIYRDGGRAPAWSAAEAATPLA